MAIIGLAVALGLTIVALGYIARRQQQMHARMARLDSRVRMLGIVDVITKAQPEPQRRRRHLRALVLLPIGWAVRSARSQPARAAAVAGGAAATGIAATALTLIPGESPDEGPVRAEASSHPPTEIYRPPKPAEAPRRSPVAPAPVAAGEGAPSPAAPSPDLERARDLAQPPPAVAPIDPGPAPQAPVPAAGGVAPAPAPPAPAPPPTTTTPAPPARRHGCGGKQTGPGSCLPPQAKHDEPPRKGKDVSRSRRP